MLYDLKHRIRKFGETRRLNVGTANDMRWITNVHAGDDYAATYGNDASYAIQDGTVVFSGWSSTYGWHVRYRLKSDSRTIIGHHSLSAKSSLKAGDPVWAGKTLIGHGGKSSSGATGNHVHIQAETNGKPVPPRTFIDAGLAKSGAVKFDNSPPPEQKAPDMSLRLIRNSTSGLTVLCSMETGFWYPIPNIPERDLLVAHLKPDPDLYVDRPDNEFRLFESLAKLARGDAPAIDTSALARALAGVLGGGTDGAALAAVLDDRIDDIAKAVNDDAARRLQG